MIRPARAEDSPGVLELVMRILSSEFPSDQAAYAAGGRSGFASSSESHAPDDLSKLMETYQGPTGSFFVAEEDHRIVGTCGIKAESKRTAILRRLFVDPRYRGRGIGARLLREALDFCRAAGFREVVIRTSARMEQAVRLCKDLGFREDGHWILGNATLVRFRLRIT